jgi:hypothetical protein
MTVYVDNMYLYPLGRFGRMKMSHLIADTEAELHAMASAIGVARKWYQGDHYDICISMRRHALELGARGITLKQCAMMCANRRVNGSLGDPETAEQMWRDQQKERGAEIRASLGGIAAALGVPPEMLAEDLSSINYSTARHGRKA